MKRKGIVLAGGAGSRLHPITLGCSKQLLQVYNKPMVYYPISVLMLAGIRDILVMTTPEDANSFKRLLGAGKRFGVNIEYAVQPTPGGLAQAFLIGEKFIDGQSICLVLGDNIFYGPGLTPILQKANERIEGATIFAYQVGDARRFGVVEFDKENRVISVEEKPSIPKSNFAITGLYFYDAKAVEYAKTISCSPRGELEITSINQCYLEAKKLNVELLRRGFAWLDTGTEDSLLEASQFIQTIEKRQGYMIASLEEIALSKGWISLDELANDLSTAPRNPYFDYLRRNLDPN
jgi:glucose-1-phosphate thymidylyltransferase